MNTDYKIQQKPSVVNPPMDNSALFKQKRPQAYTQKKRPLSEFTMTKRILELRDNDGKNICMHTKFILAYLMNAALKKSDPPTLLTSVRQLSECFNMSRTAVRQALKKLQTIQIKEVPLIEYHTYSKEEAMQQLKEAADANKLYQTDGIDTKRAQILQRNIRNMLRLRDRERPIEIKITSYEFIKYDNKRENDFFFDVHSDMYKDDLSITERVLLFFIQSRINQNQNKNMQERCNLHIQTFAETFNFYIHYIQGTLKSLHDAGYIVYMDEKESQETKGWKNTYVTLTEKGTRTIRRFANGSAQKYSRENRKKMEEEKQRLKEEQEKTKNGTQYPKPDQRVLQDMKKAEAPTCIPNTAHTQSSQSNQANGQNGKKWALNNIDTQNKQKEQDMYDKQAIQNRQEEMIRQYRERQRNSDITPQERGQIVDHMQPQFIKRHPRVLT